MTGKELLEALSFVDESYIEEADSGKIRNRVQIKKLLPLAACVCLVLSLWMLTVQILMPRHVVPPASFMEAPEEINKGTTEVVETYPAQGSNQMLEAEENPNACGEPHLLLRIEAWTGNGFYGTVEGIMNSENISLGDRLQVELSVNAWTVVRQGNVKIGTQRLPTEVDFPPGTIVQIQYSLISEEEGIIVAVCVSDIWD